MELIPIGRCVPLGSVSFSFLLLFLSITGNVLQILILMRVLTGPLQPVAHNIQVSAKDKYSDRTVLIYFTTLLAVGYLLSIWECKVIFISADSSHCLFLGILFPSEKLILFT